MPPTRRAASFSLHRPLVALTALLLAVSAAGAPAETKLKASDGVAFDSLGDSIAVSGDVIAVGTPFHDSGEDESGAVYVFRRDGEAWTQEATLGPEDPAKSARMGWSLSASGGTVVAGAPYDSALAGGAGAVYVFVRDGAVWKQEAKLVPADLAEGDNFGYAVSVHGDTIAVGAPSDDDVADGTGSVYVFRRSGEDWTEEAKLTADDAAQFDELGFSVAVNGDTVVAGAHYNSDYDQWTGAAYVFERSGSEWSQAAKLYAEDPGRGNQFGWSVAVHGDTAVVGAVFQGSGSAYVYRRTTSWAFEQKLPRVGIGPSASYGHSVAVRDDVVAVGAPADTVSTMAGVGSVWVYTREGATWTHHVTLTPSDAAEGQQLGVWVDLGDDLVAAGAPGDADLGLYAGAGYVFEGLFEPTVENDACLLPKKVKVGRKGVAAAGTLHLGPDPVDLTLPLTVEIGDATYPLAGLEAVKGGKSYAHKGEEITLVVKPTRFGSSRAKFKLRAAAEPPDGELEMRLASDDLDAACTVTLASGRFGLGKTPGTLAAPACAPEKLKAKLVGGGKDAVKVTARLASMPAMPADVEVRFGDFSGSVAAGDLVERGGRYLYRSATTSLCSVKIDPARGTISVLAKGADLGAVPEGPSAVELGITLGAEEHTIRLRMVRKKTSFRY